MAKKISSFLVLCPLFFANVLSGHAKVVLCTYTAIPVTQFCVKSEKKFMKICTGIIFFVKFATIKPTYAKLGRVRGQPNAIKPHYKKLKNQY